MSEQELFDMGQNFIRTQLATIQGAAVPLPYGGRFRQVMVDLNPDQLTAKGLSASDVSSALGNQNLIFPAGTAKIGDKDYQIRLNSSPRILDELNNLPLRVVNGATVYLKDVAQVRDGYSVQTSIVRTNGTPRRAADGDAQRQGLHTGGGEQRQGRAAQDPGRPAARPQGAAACSISRCSCARPSTAWCAKA